MAINAAVLSEAAAATIGDEILAFKIKTTIITVYLSYGQGAWRITQGALYMHEAGMLAYSTRFHCNIN